MSQDVTDNLICNPASAESKYLTATCAITAITRPINFVVLESIYSLAKDSGKTACTTKPLENKSLLDVNVREDIFSMNGG